VNMILNQETSWIVNAPPVCSLQIPLLPRLSLFKTLMKFKDLLLLLVDLLKLNALLHKAMFHILDANMQTITPIDGQVTSQRIALVLPTKSKL